LLNINNLIPRRVDSEYVFNGKLAGEPFYDLKRQFEKVVSKAKLQDVTFHTLRQPSSHEGCGFGNSAGDPRTQRLQDNVAVQPSVEDHKRAAVQALDAPTAGPKEEAKVS
jgi:hypothetical protein